METGNLFCQVILKSKCQTGVNSIGFFQMAIRDVCQFFTDMGNLRIIHSKLLTPFNGILFGTGNGYDLFDCLVKQPSGFCICSLIVNFLSVPSADDQAFCF